MIQSLTSFRFITAFAVFIFHCNGHLGLNTGILSVDKFIKNGAVFMTGFFVLSGFIITHVYQNWDFSKNENIFSFYLRRFAKIYPTYIAATIVFFACFKQATFSNSQWLQIFVNDPLITQAFIPSMWSLGLNGGTWSITVEAFLYFLFPFLILISGKSWKIAIFGVIIAAIVSLNMAADPQTYLYANPVARLGDFMVGIGFYFIKDKNIFKNRFIHILLIISLIFSVIKLGAFEQWFLQGQPLFVILFGAWIACVYHTKSRFYDNKIMAYLGLISYSFYLWQFWAFDFAKDLHFSSPVYASLTTFGINICFSMASYHLLEERARAWIVKRFMSKNLSITRSSSLT